MTFGFACFWLLVVALVTWRIMLWVRMWRQHQDLMDIMDQCRAALIDRALKQKVGQ